MPRPCWCCIFNAPYKYGTLAYMRVCTHMMDIRFKNASVFVVAGPSSSGKTVFVSKLIKYKKFLFQYDIPSVKWFYSGVGGQPPEGVVGIKVESPGQGLPEDWVDLIKPWDMAVFDDLLMETAADKSLTAAFTRLAHHKPCTLVYITQNLFHKSADARTRSLNMHYLVLMKNPRDASQIGHIARQMYPGNAEALIKAYQQATHSTPYSYILIDFHQDTPAELRIRTNIFDANPSVFLINTLPVRKVGVVKK